MYFANVDAYHSSAYEMEDIEPPHLVFKCVKSSEN